MKKRLLVILMLVLCLVGCGAQKEQSSEITEDGRTTLVLAIFDENPDVNKQVELFNQSNDTYKIEIQKYGRASWSEEDGVSKLQREIISGEGPDIIDFGWDYSTSDIAGKYTENLLPYLENTEYGEDCFENVIDAFSYQDGLYALPVSFKLETFVGNSEELGGRTSWNVSEMISCYEEKPQDMLLYPGQMKMDVFGTILTGSMEYYIDWETGTCNFDGEEFRRVLEFCNTFPDELVWDEDFSDKQAYENGDALLKPSVLSSIYDVCGDELLFGGENVTYIGFPVEGESGTVIRPAEQALAISIGSKHKEAAWEFICQFLDKTYQSDLDDNFPIRRSVLEESLLANRTTEYTTDADGNQKPVAKGKLLFAGEEPVEIYCVTEEQAGELLHLIESATICSSIDYQLYNVFLEEAGSYFSGDKTLEEAVAVMQSRASIYIGEKVK